MMITYFVKHAPVARKIQIAFGLIIVLVALAAGFLAMQSNNVKDLVNEYRQTARLTVRVTAASAHFQQLRAHALRFEISGDQAEMTKVQEINEELEKSFKKAEDNAISADFKAQLAKLQTKRDAYLVAVQQTKTDPTAAARRNALGASFSDLSVKMAKTSAARQDVLGGQMSKTLEASTNAALILIAVIVIGGGAFALFLASIIAAPFARTTAQMEDVAKGNIDMKLDDLDRRDDVGRLRNALAVFIANGQEMRRLQALTKEKEVETEVAKRATMNDLANSFEASVSHVVETVAAAATELEATSESLSRTAQDTSMHSNAVARTADTSASNVQTVASASEEMSASISVISQQVNQAARIAREAERKAAETNATVVALSEAAGKIGAVVSLISDIASQTNLLALNATIEAARAGEAGKGFAVVASEVKSLAEQTAKATDEISNQIGGVQTATHEAVTAIDGISKTISEINEISASISAAVEEQMAAVREISRNTSDVAAATSEVSQAIGLVQQGSSETGAAAQQSLGAARELGQQAIRLKQEVDGFLIRVRAA